MKKIPKNIQFNPPEGYFENLPDQILSRRSRNNHRLLISRFAAAAVLVLGVLLFVFKFDTSESVDFEANLDQQVELYITSGFWAAEDILAFSDDPDAVLDRILEMEWGEYDLEDDPLEIWEY